MFSSYLHTLSLPDALPIFFLPRHGRGHRLSPTNLNARANIDALKRAGCTDILSISAVGSLREDMPPGRSVIADQFSDRTFARQKSFFGHGIVARVRLADPVCLCQSLSAAVVSRRPVANGMQGGHYTQTAIASGRVRY